METDDRTTARSGARFAAVLARVPTGYWLLVAMAVYFVIAVSLSWLRAVNLATDTWDLGLYQQALWSTAHGRPFWETADFETGGFGSLLQVHSIFLLYLLVPLYAAAPSELTLFVVQSAIVAAAAYPLFLLTRDLTASSRWGLAAGILYLSWAPTLAANLYDFHAESLLPLEIFLVVLLFERGRYGWGLLAAGIAFVSFELAPVLLFFVGVFFLLPDSRSFHRWSGAFRERRKRGVERPALVRGIREALAERRVLASLSLLLLSLAAYGLLLVIRQDYLAGWLGLSAFPPSPSGYTIGITPAQLNLSWANLAIGFGFKLTSWILFFALLGFIPFLAPRTLVLTAPWVTLSFFSSNTSYVFLGFQYGFIVGSALMVGLAYGLARLHRWLKESRSEGAPPMDPAPPSTRTPEARAPRATSRRLTALVLGLVVLVSVNVSLSPANPALDNAAFGSAYLVSYAPAPGFRAVEQLVGLIPAAAPLIASDNIFPLVANDVNAYSFFWVANPFLNLPFNATHLPPFVLVSSTRTYAVPAWLSTVLYQPSVYGVRGIVWSSPAGAVLLFEESYSGPTTAFDAPPNPAGAYFGNALDPQIGGYVTRDPAARYPSVIESAPGAAGALFGGPSFDLPVGNDTFSFAVEARAATVGNPPTASASTLFLGASSWASGVGFSESLSYGQLAAGGWINISFSVAISAPVIGFLVSGFAYTPAAVIEVEALTVLPTP